MRNNMKNMIEDIIPAKFELAQNYPNPFSDRTTIKFCIPDRMKVKLEIYNSNNRRVKILLNEIKKAGTYEVEFSAKELDSGEYLYKLETDNLPDGKSGFFDAKKMTVIK